MESLTINNVPDRLADEIRELAAVHTGGDVSHMLLLLVAREVSQPLYFAMAEALAAREAA